MASTYEALLLANMQFALNPPIAFLTAGTSTTISSSTWTAVAFNTNVVDTYSGHSTSTNNTQYFFQVPGWYEVSGSVFHGGGTASTIRAAVIGYSGTPTGGATRRESADAADESVIASAYVLATASGDYCQLLGYRGDANTGTVASTSTTPPGPRISWMTVRYLHQ